MTNAALAMLKRIAAPRSLRYQLLTRSLTILGVLLLFIGLSQYFLMKDFVYQNKAESMRAQMSAVPRDLFRVSFSVEPDDDGSKQDGFVVRRKPMLFLPDASLAIVDSEGNFTNLTENNGIASPMLAKREYEQILNGFRKKDIVDYRVARDSSGEEQIIVFRAIGTPRHPVALLQMSTRTGPLHDVLIRQLVIFALLSLIALLAGLAVSMPVVRRTLVPLSRIVSAVQRTNAGNLSERLPLSQGQEEIDRLSVSFNGMLERLESSFEAERQAKERMRRFVADASHELRTPLTAIHGFLEVLLRGAADKKEQLYGALHSMHGESKRINKLVEDLLLLAKLDRAPQLLFANIRLDETVRQMEPQLRMLAGSRHVVVDADDAVRGRFDSDKMKQVILNLFHNAVSHTDPKRGEIAVSLTLVPECGGALELSVRDNGRGIAPEHLPHIFERFYRSETSRARTEGGAGLGLAITKSIVEAHGGELRVESKVGVGTAFVIRLPIDLDEDR
jgi:two-component system, OmpR family, sensor kinase